MMQRLTLSFLETHTAYIGVGSNLGNKRWHCLTAIEQLDAMDGITIEQRSSLYRSEPIGVPGQEWYVNAVVRLRTSLQPHELLAALHLVEAQLLRKREVHWGPRTVDLDLLFYDDLISREKNLTLPHPEVHRRSFVLMPLVEIAPKLVHPVLKKSAKALLKELEHQTGCHPLPVDALNASGGFL